MRFWRLQPIKVFDDPRLSRSQSLFPGCPLAAKGKQALFSFAILKFGIDIDPANPARRHIDQVGKAKQPVSEPESIRWIFWSRKRHKHSCLL
jgi:hypothetical protein